MREQFKNVGVVLALIIAGFSLPTSIMSLTSKAATPITEVNNYYYYTIIIALLIIRLDLENKLIY